MPMVVSWYSWFSTKILSKTVSKWIWSKVTFVCELTLGASVGLHQVYKAPQRCKCPQSIFPGTRPRTCPFHSQPCGRLQPSAGISQNNTFSGPLWKFHDWFTQVMHRPWHKQVSQSLLSCQHWPVVHALGTECSITTALWSTVVLWFTASWLSLLFGDRLSKNRQIFPCKIMWWWQRQVLYDRMVGSFY